jgi:hypothetical protein
MVTAESDLVPVYDAQRNFMGHRGMEFLAQ